MAKAEGPGWHRESRRHSEAAKKGARRGSMPKAHARLPPGVKEDKDHWKMVTVPDTKFYTYKGLEIYQVGTSVPGNKLSGKVLAPPETSQKLGVVLEADSLEEMVRKINKRLGAQKAVETKRTSPESHAFKQMNMAWKRADRLDGEIYLALQDGDHRKAANLRKELLDAEKAAKDWEHELSKLHNKGRG